jgi:hypothetical protein
MPPIRLSAVSGSSTYSQKRGPVASANDDCIANAGVIVIPGELAPSHFRGRFEVGALPCPDAIDFDLREFVSRTNGHLRVFVCSGDAAQDDRSRLMLQDFGRCNCCGDYRAKTADRND